MKIKGKIKKIFNFLWFCRKCKSGPPDCSGSPPQCTVTCVLDYMPNFSLLNLSISSLMNLSALGI